MAGTHKMGASYSGLYEEGEVEHINVPPVPSHFFFFFFLRQSLNNRSHPQRGKS